MQPCSSKMTPCFVNRLHYFNVSPVQTMQAQQVLLSKTPKPLSKCTYICTNPVFVLRSSLLLPWRSLLILWRAAPICSETVPYFGHHFQHHFLRGVPQLYRNTINTTLTSQSLQCNNYSFPSVCWTCGSRQQKTVLREQRQWEECLRKCRTNWKSLRLAIYSVNPPPQLITDLLYTQCQATHLTDAKLSSSPEFPT